MPTLNTEEILMRDGLLTINEAASFLRISRSSLYTLITKGAIPTVKFTKSRRVPRRALIDLAAANLDVVAAK